MPQEGTPCDIRNIEVITDAFQEHAELWKPYLEKVYGLTATSVSSIPTVHVKLVDRKSQEIILLDTKASLVHGDYRWGKTSHVHSYHDMLVFPAIKIGYEWSWKHSCAWLVTAHDGNDIPIVPCVSVEKVCWGLSLREKVGFDFLSSLPEVRQRYIHGFNLYRNGQKSAQRGCSVIDLRYGNKVITDTARDGLALIYNFLRYPLACTNVLMRTVADLEGDKQSELARYRGLFEAIEHFFDEAIKRFDETKEASRHKKFGEFRLFLDQWQALFKKTYSQ
ncbi:MAG: hypothetical protein U1A23_02850 [Candidatus Sungbacteria bacterium]|nr:hypothetical protein [bacterium]MDZ4285842.1 hypothetical protein [Candidatus Sungbacteria bacterium]